MADDQKIRTSSDPSRHAGAASTATPGRGHEATVPEDPAGSTEIARTGALWIVFPVLCVVVLIGVLLLVFS